MTHDYDQQAELYMNIGPPSSLHLYTSPSELHLRADSPVCFYANQQNGSKASFHSTTQFLISYHHYLSSIYIILIVRIRIDIIDWNNPKKRGPIETHPPLYTLDHIRRTKPKSTADSSRDIG